VNVEDAAVSIEHQVSAGPSPPAAGVLLDVLDRAAYRDFGIGIIKPLAASRAWILGDDHRSCQSEQNACAKKPFANHVLVTSRLPDSPVIVGRVQQINFLTSN
jgi:hypothetical protein